MKKTNSLRLMMTLVMGGLMAANVMAVPAKRGWQTRTQADGTTVEVQLVGDEFYHYLINREGQQVQLNENGMYEVVGPRPTKAQHLARRAQSPRLAGQRRVAKDYGDLQISRILVLLVNFSDVKMQSKYNNAYYTKMLNAETQSVRDYFRASSEGKYVPQFDVFGPYDLDQNEYYYGHNVKIDDEDTDQRPDQMVVDACAKAAADGCDFSNYDTNNDGKVDNVYVIYAGYGENYNGSKEYWIWPHSWAIYEKNVTGTLEYNGKTLGHYACSAELTGISGTDADGLGTFCHEFSHVIGLPDYYDADYEENGDNEGYTPGQWSLMDQGSYNNDGNSPALYSIYDKYFMGWKTPTILKDPDDIEIKVGGDNARQITKDDKLASPTNTNTVYYLENRQKEGYDAGLPGHGLIIWKVTYDEDHWADNDLNNYEGTLLYTILPANSKSTDLSSDDTPFPGSKTVTEVTPITGHKLTEIAESAGVITFKYNGGKQVVVDPFDIKWKANGEDFTTTKSTEYGKVVLPATNPTSCSDGKVFVGWCKVADYENATVAPAFVEAGDAAAEGDIYYAVYAKKISNAATSTTYTFTSNKWADATSSWTSVEDGTKYDSTKDGIQVTSGDTGAGAKTKSSVNNVTKVTVNYCTNASSGKGSIDVYVGTKKVSQDVTAPSSGGATLKDLEFEFDNLSGVVSFTVNCTTNSLYVHSVTITAGGEAYSKYTTSCEKFVGNEDYTIAFFNNGTKIDEKTVKEGSSVTPPTVTAPCADYTFVGWWTAELAANNKEAKTWVTDFTATQDQNYYAIFSKTVTSSGDAAASVSFQTAGSDGSTDLSTVAGGILNFTESATGIESYTGSKIYKGTAGLKIGTSKAHGQLWLGLKDEVTANTITIVTSKYNDENLSLKVTVDYSTVVGTKAVTNGTLTYISASPISFSQIDIETTANKRAYIKSVTIGGSAGSTTYYSSAVDCTATDIESIEPATVRGQKILRDGQLYILVGEQMYTITGARVK